MPCDDVTRLMECSGSGNAMHCSFGMACRTIFPTSASSCPVSTRLKRRRPSTAILLFSSLKDLALHMKVAGDVTMGFNTKIV